MARADVMNQGIYDTLMAQIDKIMRHVNQGSYETRYRYEEAVDRFCQFISDEFRVQKFKNTQEKHVVAYVHHMQEAGLSASTIKTDLSAIRFFYDQSGGRNQLPKNSELDLERRRFGGIDRAWTGDEYRSAVSLARGMGDVRVAYALGFARTLGLRIHEVVRLDRSQLAAALRQGFLTVKGKGGKWRDVPLTPEAKTLIGHIAKDTPRGHKVFITPDEKAHQVIKEIQNWIYHHRDKWTDRKVTIHGLRHAYAQERYQEALGRLGDERAARAEVSKLLGHERDEVTRIYTPSDPQGTI